MDFKVLIIGGGSCGLALAQGLKKAGIDHVIYERDSSEEYHRRPRDWGSLMHWGADHLEKCLPADLWDRRSEMYVDPWNDCDTPPAYWNGETGEMIKHIDAPPTVRVSRRKVRQLLREGLKLEFSKRLCHLSSNDQTVTLTFSDNTTATGSVAIGCDGGRSIVRSRVVGPSAAHGFSTDYTMINTSSRLSRSTATALRAKHPIITTAFHPSKPIRCLVATLDVPSPSSLAEDISFQICTGWFGSPRKQDFATPADAMRFFRARFAQLGDPFRSAGLDILEDAVLPVDEGWNFKPIGEFDWDNHGGKVTLAGDAAHSMLPHRGQGLNNALMDAAQLVDALKRVVRGDQGLEEAVSGYEREMRPRGSEEVDRTMLTAQMSRLGTLEKSPLSTVGLHKV